MAIFVKGETPVMGSIHCNKYLNFALLPTSVILELSAYVAVFYSGLVVKVCIGFKSSGFKIQY